MMFLTANQQKLKPLAAYVEGDWANGALRTS